MNDLEEEVRDLERLRKRFVGEKIPGYMIVSFQDMSDPGMLCYAIVSWHWDFGDGETSKEENPVHIFNKAEICKVTLTVKNECGVESAPITQRMRFY